MRKKYVKPAIASEVINAAASQACDVNQEERFCRMNVWWERICPVPWKVQNEPCGVPPPYEELVVWS